MSQAHQKTYITLLILCLLPLTGFASTTVSHLYHASWRELAAILVIFMAIPGLTLFYSGLVQSKNVLSVIAQCFVIVALSSILWCTIGYALALTDGGSWSNFIGDPKKVLIFATNALVPTTQTNNLSYMLFQMGFAAITPAIITGSFAERVRFIPLLIFICLWDILVYYPVCHWVWGGGWLDKIHMLDFAGGAVVHTTSGVAGLMVSLFMGKRLSNSATKRPHNYSLTAIGAGILWFGWFGFNSGAATNSIHSAMTILVSQMAASACILTWMLCDWFYYKRFSALSIMMAAVSGLVAVTPASGYVSILGALCIGFTTGLICHWFCQLSFKNQFEDSLDVFGIHGLGGLIGSLLTGVFASTALGGLGLPAHHSIGKQVLIQLIGLGAISLWTIIITMALLFLLKHIMGLRVTKNEEQIGLDLQHHGERAYRL